MSEHDWSTDPVRDSQEHAHWLPSIEVSPSGTRAGPAEDGGWIVGRPGSSVLRAESPRGVIALLPLLDKSMVQVESELGASVVRHPLRFEAVIDAALDDRSSGHWTGKAIAWLEAGFPSVWFRDALRRIIEDKHATQHDRQVAQTLVSRMTY